MTTNEEVSKSRAKPRRLPEVPKDQEPYDVTKPPKKPPRLVPRLEESPRPNSRRPKSSRHKRSSSMTDLPVTSTVTSGKLDEDRKPLARRSEKLKRAKSASFDDGHVHVKEYNSSPTCLDANVKQVPTATLTMNRFPKYLWSNDAVLNRRCGSCHQRIFLENERCFAAQSYLFHTSCFSCAICSTTLDVTDYCYITHHEKFYCSQHYNEICKAEGELGNDKRDMDGIGPGTLPGIVLAYGNYHNEQRKRKQMLKKLVEFQQRRSTLENVKLQLEEARRNAKREEKLLLWKHWFDVTYEKTLITKGVTELAYQIKESELCEEQEQIERKLERLKKRRDEGTREENNEQEKQFLQCALDVIEKRDLLLLELEIERRRDDEEIEELKSSRQQTENSEDLSHTEKAGHVQSSNTFSNELLDECVIL